MTKYITFPVLTDSNLEYYGSEMVYLTEIQKKALVCMDYILTSNDDEVRKFINEYSFFMELSAESVQQIKDHGPLHNIIKEIENLHIRITKLSHCHTDLHQYTKDYTKVITEEHLGTAYSSSGQSALAELKDKSYHYDRKINEIDELKIKIDKLEKVINMLQPNIGAAGTDIEQAWQ